MELRWYFDQTQINWDELSELYRIAPLSTKPPDFFKVVFSNSKFKCFVYHKDQLIGAGRGLADGKDCSYLCDIAVHPDYQGQGLGKEQRNGNQDGVSSLNRRVSCQRPNPQCGNTWLYTQLRAKAP